MKSKITRSELIAAARSFGLGILEDKGGYRVVEETDSGAVNYVFPGAGEPSESKRACAGFLFGIKFASTMYRARTARPIVTSPLGIK